MLMLTKYKPLIEQASQRIYDLVKRTALDKMPILSDKQNNTIWLKREDQQPVFSYKLRGAYNMMCALSDAEKQQGVIAASAGNHAQGVAMAGQKLGVSTTIVMPKTTPDIKVNAVRRLDGEVILHGNNYDEAKHHALKLAADNGKAFVPPYDHPLVIAGQATVAVELCEQLDTAPEYIFVPIGGGGLIAGIALVMKQRYPEARIIGVEPAEAACMQAAIKANEIVVLDQIGIFADGAAVREAGLEPFNICRELLDEIICVSNDEICAAVKDIFQDTRAIAEPAGALAVAGLKQYVAKHQLANQNLVAIFSGANVNFDRLRHIAELSALGQDQEALLVTEIPEQPGSFLAFCHDLGPRLITEFNYRYADDKTAQVFAGVQLRQGVEEKNQLLTQLSDKGYQVEDLSDNEVAKMHIRYMVGGHATSINNERLYRFEFPERSGALLHFLKQMSGRWNISLFHYRNHGAAYGRVLIGFQVSDADMQNFNQFLQDLNINYWEETDNNAYQKLLG